MGGRPAENPGAGRPPPGSFPRFPAAASSRGPARKETREAVLGTALRLVHGCGDMRVPVGDIAPDAGVPRVTFYEYCPEREGILAALPDRLPGADGTAQDAGAGSGRLAGLHDRDRLAARGTVPARLRQQVPVGDGDAGLGGRPRGRRGGARAPV